MSTVPKIVIERLKAAESVGNHPDANLLTAFAEHALGKPEREVVLAHLAKCGDCRDIVALALPAADVVTPVIVPARHGWLTWPALRWGLVAAGIVVVASFGVVQYQRLERRESMSARLMVPQKDVESRSEAPSLAAPAPLSASAEESERTDGLAATKKEVKSRSAKPLQDSATLNGFVAAAPGALASSGAAVRGPLHKQYPGGPKLPAQWQQNMQNNVQNVAVPPPPAVPKQQALDLKGDKASQPASPQFDAYANNAPQATPTPARSAPSVDKAKPPVTVEATSEASAVVAADSAKPQELPKQSGYMAVNGRNLAQLVTLSPASGPRWTIGSTGALQRSLDQGNTWQDVDVTAALASAAAGSIATVSGGTLAKEATRERDFSRKAAKRQAANPTFRTVTAFGTDVWAGGVGGALYHSQDAGLHWARVTPSADGNSLTGDVLTLDFSDAQHGKVTTSSPEVWITADGGQTWQRQ